MDNLGGGKKSLTLAYNFPTNQFLSHAHLHTYTHSHLHTLTPTHTHTHKNTHTHTHTHIHTHTHTEFLTPDFKVWPPLLHRHTVTINYSTLEDISKINGIFHWNCF